MNIAHPSLGLSRETADTSTMNGPSTAHRLSAEVFRLDDVCAEVLPNLSRELISIIVEHVASGWRWSPTINDTADESDQDEGYEGGPQPHNRYCDVCGMDPIVGICYASRVKRNYDLCEGCHAALPEEEKREEYSDGSGWRQRYDEYHPIVLPTREEKRREQAETCEKVALACPNVSKAAGLAATRRVLKRAALIDQAWRDEVMPLLAENKEAHKRAKIAAYREMAVWQQRLAVESMKARMQGLRLEPG